MNGKCKNKKQIQKKSTDKIKEQDEREKNELNIKRHLITLKIVIDSNRNKSKSWDLNYSLVDRPQLMCSIPFIFVIVTGIICGSCLSPSFYFSPVKSQCLIANTDAHSQIVYVNWSESNCQKILLTLYRIKMSRIDLFQYLYRDWFICAYCDVHAFSQKIHTCCMLWLTS